jgi:catechol 2,3-dioxygenase-like lactoylglutathione lyase family enzyme
VITGAHTIVFAHDAEAARAFFRDVLGFPSVDAGDGWLIFALPPAELALHPGSGWGGDEGRHMLFFMCDDVARTVEELETKGVEFTEPVADEGWGLVTRLEVPGAGEIGLYEPKHESPLESGEAGRSRTP